MIGTVAPFSMSSPSPVSGDDYQFDVPDLSHQEIQELAEDKITSLVDGGSMSPAEAEIISGNIDNVIKSSSGSNPMIFVLLVI